MCGRYYLISPAELVATRFHAGEPPPFRPRYNLAPQQEAPVVVNGGARRLVMMRWGLVPSWSKDAAAGHRMINARSETAPEKPSFRTPFRKQRALIPADGFYEWKREGSGKTPFALRLASGEPFAMAGLWDRWRAPDGVELLSFTILTTSANALVAGVHERMPVILSRDAEDSWLEPEAPPDALRALMAPYTGTMQAVPLGTAVNNPRNDGPEILRPAT
jgi:putative SOS response-associated peptidase YedK